MFESLKKWFPAKGAGRIEGAGAAQQTMPPNGDEVPHSPVNTMQRAYDRAVVEANIQRKGLERPEDKIFFDAIERQRAADPLVGPKLGQKEIVQILVDALSKSDPKGVHIESLFCMLGSLAGYACQAAVFAKAVLHGPAELYGLHVLGTNTGDLFFGDKLNTPLAESQYSVWALAAGYAVHLGAENLLDLTELFDRVSKSFGKEYFGMPRFPGNAAGDMPINYVKTLWPALLPSVKFFCKTPDEWPILFGLAVQEAMELTKGKIPPGDALAIVMESAVPMSKVTF